MAGKRMFSMKIVDSDAFLDMPVSAQALYFHLNMRADDDGFINNPRKVQRIVGASEDDLKLLLAKEFLFGYENGVVLITDWHMHNTIRKDRYTPTQYQDILQRLHIKPNGAYTDDPGYQLATSWQPSGNQLATTRQPLGNADIVVEIDKNIGTDSVKDEDKPRKGIRFVPPKVEEVRSYCAEIGSGIDPQNFVDYYTTRGWLVGKVPMRDWKAAVRTWEKNERSRSQGQSSEIKPVVVTAEETERILRRTREMNT